jgi:glycosyltransferase involved in cell wall biosynthesis
MVMHEAFICGLPVIGTNIGAMAEKITDGKNGFTFPPSDHKALAKIIRRIAENPAILNDVKKNVKNMRIPIIGQEAYAYHNHYMDVVYGKK